MMMAWALTSLSFIALVVGLGLAAWRSGSRPPNAATRILAERFARGDIQVDEYRERLELLSPGERRRVQRTPVVVLIVVGLLGTVGGGTWAVASSWDDMAGMWGGDMGSMMSMMQSGPTERIAEAPEPEAITTGVLSREFSFSPAEISLRKGETVNIELQNEGHMFHTFTIPELNFDLRAQSGDSVAGSLRPPEAGTYEFICTVPQHAEMGMRGRVVVSE